MGKRFPVELKEQVIQRVRNEGISGAQAARDHGIPTSTVYSWLSAKLKIPSNILQINKLKRENAELKIRGTCHSNNEFVLYKKQPSIIG